MRSAERRKVNVLEKCLRSLVGVSYKLMKLGMKRFVGELE